MDRLSEILGFQGQYVLYPLLALAIAGLAHWAIRHYLKRWAAKTESKIDDVIVGYLESAVLPLLLFVLLYSLSYWLPFPENIVRWIRRGLAVFSIAVLAMLSAKSAGVLIDNLGRQRDTWRKFLQPLRTLVNVLFALLGIALSLKTVDINFTDEGVRIVRVVGILIGAYIVVKIVALVVGQLERLVEDRDGTYMSETEKRAKTLGKIINNAGLVLITGVALMMVLSEFGMDITPIITGAGIAGLAVGFGAQNLVRDIISGFFLILEDQVRVGDVAIINGTGGLVEAIRLRTIVLRDLQGVVHVFPNGEVKQVSNMTKEWSRYVIDVGVAYKENVDHVIEVLKKVGEELQHDPRFAPLILEPLQVLGVDDFAESQVTIKIMIKTLPLKQWEVGRELRRRIKNTFDQEGIEIPFPHVSVYFGEASKPFELSLSQTAKAALLQNDTRVESSR